MERDLMRRRREDVDSTIHPDRDNQCLPRDIIPEILSRVPAKSLIRFKSVCKTWLLLISSPEFARHHLHIWRSKPTLIVVKKKSFACFTYDFQQRHARLRKFHPPGNMQREVEGIIVAAMECLLLLRGSLEVEGRRKMAQLVVYNPSTRKNKLLPPLQNPSLSPSSRCSLLYDASAKSYVVVVALFAFIGSNFSHGRCGLFRLGHESNEAGENDAWRKVTLSYRVCVASAPVHLPENGTLNWIAFSADRQDSFILPMDITREEFGEIVKLPCQPRRIHRRLINCSLLEMKGSLSLANWKKKGLVFWILKDWERGMWIKYQKISLSAMVGNPENLAAFMHLDFEFEFLARIDDSVLMRRHSRWYLYNLNRRVIEGISFGYRNSHFDYSIKFVHVKSLVCWD